MRVVLLVLMLLAMPVAACAAPSGDLRAEMIARLAKAMPGATLSADPDDPLVIVFKGGDWGEGSFNLHRIDGYCRQASARDCANVKAEFVAKVARKPAKATAASLRLIVRDRDYKDYVDSVGKQAPDKGDFAKYRQIGDDLFAFLAADSADTIALVGDVTLKELGLTADQAWAQAQAQTRAVLPPLPDPQQLTKTATAYEDKEYLASLLIDLPAWGAIAAKVGPDLFVTAVSDQFVFVGTLPDGPKLEKFRKTVAEDCRAQERCVSPHIYRFRDGRWVIAK